MVSSLRQPRRRAVSVGPQSVADAYEVLAYQERKRRESHPSTGTNRPYQDEVFAETQGRGLEEPGEERPDAMDSSFVDLPSATRENGVDETENINNAQGQTETVSTVQKPRVRYDVEVVTKLIVYAGTSLLQRLAHDPPSFLCAKSDNLLPTFEL